MTNSFYAPPDYIRAGRFTLPEEEAAHAMRVLRMRSGDEIVLVDGEGGWYRGSIDGADRKTVTGTIVESKRDVGEPAVLISIAMALVKHRGRFETFLEKAVELGVFRIVPLMTDRTERESLRERRAENILISAMKQCGRSRLTRLEAAMPFSDYLASEESDLRICCHERADPSRGILGVLREAAGSIALAIGPEGGFTDAEILASRSAGFQVASLGPRRLRAETAAIAAAAAVALKYDAR